MEDRMNQARHGDLAIESDVNSESTSTHSVPTATYSSITFSGDRTVNLEPDDIVVFVGPNNSGKSQALRDLKEVFSNSNEGTVITDASLDKNFGSFSNFQEFVAQNSELYVEDDNRFHLGYKFTVNINRLESYYSNNIVGIREIFVTLIETTDRLSDSNTVSSINPQTQQASHPSHLLLTDEKLEIKMSGYFSKAFGKQLILDRASGSELPLRVGERVYPEKDESLFNGNYLKRMRKSSTTLEGQGDGMRSFASVILRLLAPSTQSILLLDEPEAFLHPAQARAMGQFIAAERRQGCQLFLATHSVDVLQGLIDVAPKQLRVLRIQRDGDINRVQELEKTKVAEIGADPLMKFSSVMSGVFHNRVIVCEGDSDCMFYQTILELPAVHGDRRPDALFVHGNGNQQIWKLVSTLEALDVPVDVIADMDVLNNEHIFEKIVKSLSDDSDTIMSLADIVRTSVEKKKPALSASEIREEIKDILDDESVSDDIKVIRRNVNDVFAKASKWQDIKRAGVNGLPSGNPMETFNRLTKLCEELGLWIVPVGILERFCKSVGGDGAGWIRNVFSEKSDLEGDDELLEAREFMKRIWEAKQI